MQEDRTSAGRTKFDRRSGSSKEDLKEKDYRLNCKEKEQDLPRRCLVIKRTHPEDGVERTELRLVTYQKVGRVVDQAHVLMDAARYLQERADDAECAPPRRVGGGCRPSIACSSSAGICTSSGTTRNFSLLSSTSFGDTSRSCRAHHYFHREQLRTSLKNLVTYFARRADESDNAEWSAITVLAEELLYSVCDCIRREKPLNRSLLAQIKELNRKAKEATLHSELENKKMTTAESLEQPKGFCTYGRGIYQ